MHCCFRWTDPELPASCLRSRIKTYSLNASPLLSYVCMSCLFFRSFFSYEFRTRCHGLPVLVGSNIHVSLLLSTMELSVRQILGILGGKKRCTLGLMHVNREGGSTITSWCGGLFNLYDVLDTNQ
nr:uncharacterized protein LOC123494382 [Aegilops tauschii subsp. strangulata]